ncbi:MAG: hypothetical protein HYU66_23710 [Armatimonadetes bacterium]|nr:hypothetical protein [Armatimonadota bacterium]
MSESENAEATVVETPAPEPTPERGGAPAEGRLTSNWGAWLALIGIAGIILAGVVMPITDPTIICYWSMRAVLVPHAILAVCGIVAFLADSREAFRAVLAVALVAAVAVVVTVHVLIPVMEMHAMEQRTQDLVALAALAVAGAGSLSAAPRVSTDEALDARVAVAEQPQA